jgi:hypothetical protein
MSAAQIAGLKRGRAQLAAYQAAKKELHSEVLDSPPSAQEITPTMQTAIVFLMPSPKRVGGVGDS